MPRQIVFTTRAAKPPVYYSQAVRAAGLVFVSGTAPIDPSTGAIKGTTIREQRRKCAVKTTTSRCKGMCCYGFKSASAPSRFRLNYR